MGQRQAGTILSGGCIILTAVMVGCTGLPPSEPESGRRKSQQSYYTSNLHHENYLKADMHLMDISVKALQTLDADDTIGDEERHARVMRELEILTATAQLLKTGQEILNYSTVRPYMDLFQRDLSTAREQALLTPPDYTAATRLVKSCLYCHDNI